MVEGWGRRERKKGGQYDSHQKITTNTIFCPTPSFYLSQIPDINNTWTPTLWKSCVIYNKKEAVAICQMSCARCQPWNFQRNPQKFNLTKQSRTTLSRVKLPDSLLIHHNELDLISAREAATLGFLVNRSNWLHSADWSSKLAQLVGPEISSLFFLFWEWKETIKF